MRPVNLIPPEERHGAAAKLRGGPLAYLLIGALAALLIGITLLVTTGNELSSSKAEVTRLESENSAAEAQAAQLEAYTAFRAVHDQRVATITQLANSRFDWERMVRELSLILPGDVWLTNLTGTANPEVSVNGSAGIALRDSVPGPALEISGCATGQDAVAGFISDLKDIDGVTRVAVESSILGGAEESGASGGDESGTSVTECEQLDFIAKFQIVAAFDAAPERRSAGEADMKLNASNRTIVAVLLFVAIAVAFWMILISPKRKEADKVAEEATQLESTLAQTQARVSEGEQAQREFPNDYQQLVVLGKAVPAGDESSSLLVQLNHIADRAGVTFESLKVGAADESEAAPVAEEAVPPEGEEAAPPAEEESGSVPAAAVATEASASLQPIGAQVGPAGLSVLPYDLSFKGSFFDVADFIRGLDALIHTKGSKVAVDGRLVTLNGFALTADADTGFPHLNASFSVTTYLVPPGQGITAGASTVEPGVIEATPSAPVSNLR